MRKIKKGLSAILVMLLLICCIPSAYAAESLQPFEENFNRGPLNTSVFPTYDASTGIGEIQNGVLKFTVYPGKTSYLQIHLNEWAGSLASNTEKKGILTYSFNLTSQLTPTQVADEIIRVALHDASSGRGFRVGRLYMNAGKIEIYDGNDDAGETDLTFTPSSTNKVTLELDYDRETLTMGVDGVNFTKPFSYYPIKDGKTLGSANGFQMYLRINTPADKGNFVFEMDNFKAAYTESYTVDNVAVCSAFTTMINNGTASTENFRTALAALPDNFAKVVASDTVQAVAAIKDILYADAAAHSYPVSGKAAVDAISDIIDIIKTNIPMISINAAGTSAEIKHSLSSYHSEYGIDISFIDGYTTEEKQLFYEGLLQQRMAMNMGQFSSNAEIAAAINSAKFTADSSAAFEKYNIAHALTLPRVFDEFRNVLAIDMSYIEEEYRNQTLFILKGKTINSYSEIPAKLAEAYAEAQVNREIFSDVDGYEVDENTYSIKPGYDKEITAFPKESYFTDMTGFEWAADAVEYLYSIDIISGKDERIFSPADKVTREEFVKMIVEAFGIQITENTKDFSDVDKNEWYAPYIYAACEAGIIQGYSNGRFGVGDYITREDVATILYRTANVANVTLEVKVSTKFEDIDDISEYARYSVGVLKNNGIINGVEENVFAPRLNANRAEAAVMIYKLLVIGG